MTASTKAAARAVMKASSNAPRVTNQVAALVSTGTARKRIATSATRVANVARRYHHRVDFA